LTGLQVAGAHRALDVGGNLRCAAAFDQIFS
jgi:hypothetical protein